MSAELPERRLDSLDQIEARAAAKNARPGIREIVEAFVDAYINEDAQRTGILLARFVIKHRVGPNAWTRAIVAEELDGVALRFIKAIQRAARRSSLAGAIT